MATSLQMSHMRHQQSLNWSSAVSAGLVGTVVATGLLYAGNIAGLTGMDALKMLGAILVSPGSNPYVMGAVIDLIAGIVFAVGYAFIYTETGIDSWSGSGAMIGLVHGIIATLLLSHLSGNPSWRIPSPEVSLMSGIGPVAFVAVHVLYGAIVGSIYRDRLS
jgi:hypothetical protein